jgi:hypothetical protein
VRGGDADGDHRGDGGRKVTTPWISTTSSTASGGSQRGLTIATTMDLDHNYHRRGRQRAAGQLPTGLLAILFLSRGSVGGDGLGGARLSAREAVAPPSEPWSCLATLPLRFYQG